MSDKVISSTTQEFLDVYDIVNDMVLLKDGTVSIILQVGTMNFSLLAEQEQDAIIFTYGSLLNSLNYPIQISIQSQTKDATKYLRLLDEQVQKASSDRKAALIKQYRNFVAALIKERNVLEKHFYITVPAGPAEMGLITPSSVLPGKTAFDITAIEKSIILEKAINILEPRRDHLTAQFNRLGLYTRQLNTQEIIQNFYINYNPEAAEGQEISNNENYTTPLVRASFGGKIMQTNDQTQNVAINNMTEANLENNNQQSPTPEEILSNEPIATQASVEPVSSEQQVEPAQAMEPMEPMEPTQAMSAPVEPMSAPVEPTVLEPSEPVQEEQTQLNTEQAEINLPPTQPQQPIEEINNTETNASLDLNLDSSLINNRQPEQTPVFDPDQSMNDLMSSTQSAPVAEKTEEPVAETLDLVENPMKDSAQAEVVTKATNESAGETPSDFVEEITPLQGKLKPQTEIKPSQVKEEETQQ